MGQDYATIREATKVSVCMCERERDRGVNFCKKKFRSSVFIAYPTYSLALSKCQVKQLY